MALACGFGQMTDQASAMVGSYVMTAWRENQEPSEPISVEISAQTPKGASVPEIYIQAQLEVKTVANVEISIGGLRGDPDGTIYQIPSIESAQRLDKALREQYCHREVETTAYFAIDKGNESIAQLLRNSEEGRKVFNSNNQLKTKVKVTMISVPYYSNDRDMFAMCDASKGRYLIDCSK